MSAVNSKDVEKILSEVQYPGFSRDIVSFGVVKEIDVENEEIRIHLKFTTNNAEVREKIKKDIHHLIEARLTAYQVSIIEIGAKSDSRREPGFAADPWAGRAAIPGIKSMVAVASGKGGVGKSTVSTNLAIALSKLNFRVGLMDSDIYGPSIHIMMGVEERPMVTPEQKIIPIKKYGIKLMSMGFLIDSDSPLIWRGPMVMKAVEQFLRDVTWGELDTLIIDLPPGTGDAQLTLVQKTPLTGAVIVTTPQEVALVDARRGLKMFQKVGTKVLGIIENMSYFICPDCDKKTYIFGKNGGVQSASELGVPLLGQIPIEPEITEGGDEGAPIIIKHPDSQSAKAFLDMAKKMVKDGLF